MVVVQLAVRMQGFDDGYGYDCVSWAEDLDGDGELNLPELDIAIVQIKRDHDITPSHEEE